MSWKPEVEGLEERRRLARELGGSEAVEKQHAKGRGTIRERIDGLIDAGSFREQGPIAGHAERDEQGRLSSFAPANFVLGMARIDGRPCVVGGEDFTQKGGSPSPAGLRKSVFSEEMALRYRVPLVRFLEGGGGSVPKGGGKSKPASGGGEGLHSTPRFMSIMRVLAEVPVVSAGLGAVAGLPASRLVASHFSVMTESAQVLVAGPKLVERAHHVSMTKEELGGPKIHGRSGVVDNIARDEAHAFELIRRFLSYLPTNVWESAPVAESDDDPQRREEELLSTIPRERRKPHKIRRVIELIVDRGSAFELAPGFGRGLVTCLARLKGQPVGVLANDPYIYAGSMTADAAQKVRRFIDLCDTFHLPVVSLVDEPGFMIGPDAEKDATIRHGTAALFAVMQSTVPWVSVILRKVFGVAGAAHFGPEGHLLAWPSAESGALPIEGGVAVAFRREIEAAADPVAKAREIEARIDAERNPFARAEMFGVNDMIDPRDTRPALCDWVDWIQPRLAEHRGPRSYTFRP